jgi:uncharacterized protein (TIRG00374 family)
MKRALQLTFAVAVSFFFIWLSLRGKDLDEVWDAMRHAHLVWVVAYVGILFVIHFLRVIRWGILLEPLAKVSLSDLNKLGAVGFLLLMIVPLRLGEFGRPLLVARHLKVTRSAAMASVVFERIVDGITMGLVLVVLVWTVGPQAGENAAFVRRGGVLVLIFAARLPGQTEAMVRHTVGRIVPKLAERLIGMMQAFTNGLRVLPSVGKAVEFFGLTIAYWLTTGFGLVILGWAFDMSLSAEAGFTILGLQVIGAMIPGGPGGAGTFQWFTQLGISLFLGTSEAVQNQSAAYSNTVWALQFFQQVIYGLFFVLIGHIDLHGLIGGGGSDDKGPDDGNRERVATVAVP